MSVPRADAKRYYDELSKIIRTDNAKNEFLKVLKKYTNSKNVEDVSSTEVSPKKGKSTKIQIPQKKEDIVEIIEQEKETKIESKSINKENNNPNKVFLLEDPPQSYFFKS